MSATGPMFFPQINVGSDGTHVKDLKDSGDTVATNMAGLAVGQQRPWGHILQGHTDFHVLASDTMIAFRYRDEIFRPTVTSCWCSGFWVAKVCWQFPDDEDMDGTPSPSPDLSPTDNLGCVMDLCIC